MCRVYRRQAVGVIGPVLPGHHERVALKEAVRGFPQIEPGPGGRGDESPPLREGAPALRVGCAPGGDEDPLGGEADGLPMLRGVARPWAGEVDGGQGCAGCLRRGRHWPVRARSGTSAFRTIGAVPAGSANMRQSTAASPSSVSSRAAAGPSQRRTRKPSAGCSNPARRGHPAGQPALSRGPQWAAILRSSRRE